VIATNRNLFVEEDVMSDKADEKKNDEGEIILEANLITPPQVFPTEDGDEHFASAALADCLEDFQWQLTPVIERLRYNASLPKEQREEFEIRINGRFLSSPEAGAAYAGIPVAYMTTPYDKAVKLGWQGSRKPEVRKVVTMYLYCNGGEGGG
jgi:hypothetical protein